MVCETHYLNKDQITSFQREKIDELRLKSKEVLAKYPEYDTDFSLLRWLMGWEYKIDTIVPKLKHAVETLVNLGMAQMPLKSSDETNEFIRKLSPAAEYFPGGIMGQTSRGDVVYMQAMAKTHPKTLVKAGAQSELFQLCIIETELTFKILRQAERETGNKLGVIICMDLDGFNTDLLYTPALKSYLHLLTMLQNIFPDFARRIFVINTPMMMSAVYAMVSPALSHQTREKVKFLGADWKKEMAAEVGEENIYPHWGGTKQSANPYGDIRMGGKVPEKLWYNESHRLEADRTKVAIPARSKIEVKVYGEAGKHFHWLWRVSSGDIDFSIEHHGRAVFPMFRLSTEFHPEIGKLKCAEDGDYTFIFDNSHGKIFGKDVKYKIILE